MKYQISYFNNVTDVVPKEYDLDTWLESTINPPKHLEEAINKYRDTFDPIHKKILPCVTISSSMTTHRSLEHIKGKNPFIVLDIDRYSKNFKKPCNLCVDMLLVKEMFINHPCTYYCGFSASNDGIYAIIKLFDSDKLDDYFLYFQKKLANIGINIDSSCKDYTRLRYFSVDKEAYYNKKAKRLKLPEERIIAEQRTTTAQISSNITNTKSNTYKVEKVLEVIECASTDITQTYDDWLKIGGALYNEFGESGREYFHRISKFNAEYDYKECDSKYTHCKKLSKTTLGSFFAIASDYGVRY